MESDPNRYGGSFWGDDHILKPMVVRAPQLCEGTETTERALETGKCTRSEFSH